MLDRLLVALVVDLDVGEREQRQRRRPGVAGAAAQLQEPGAMLPGLVVAAPGELLEGQAEQPLGGEVDVAEPVGDVAHALAELAHHVRRPVAALEPVEEHQPHARVAGALLVAQRLADGQAPLEHRSGLVVAGSMEVREPLPEEEQREPARIAEGLEAAAVPGHEIGQPPEVALVVVDAHPAQEGVGQQTLVDAPGHRLQQLHRLAEALVSVLQGVDAQALLGGQGKVSRRLLDP